MANTKNVTVAFSILGASTARQDIKGLATESEHFGDAWKQSGGVIVNTLQQIETNHDKAFKKMSEGNFRVQKEGTNLLVLHEQLDEQIKRVFGDVEHAPEAIQQAYAKATQQFDAATKKIAQVKDAVSDQSEKLKEGQVQWSGWGDTINKAIGPAGAMQVQILAIGAALKAGWELGTKFAEAIGTNFDAAKSAADNLKESVKGVTDAFVTDGFVAGVTHAMAALNNLDNTITGSGDNMRGYNALVAAGVDRMAAMNLATEDLGKAWQVYQVAQQGGADGLRLFNQIVATTDPKDLGIRLEALRGRFEDLAKHVKEAKIQHDAFKAATDNVVSAVGSEIQKLIELDQRYSNHADKAQKAAEAETAATKARYDARDAAEAEANAMKPLPDAFTEIFGHLQKLTTAYQGNTGEVGAYVAALQKDVDTYKDNIDPSRQKQLQQLIDLAKNYGTLTLSQEGQLEVMVSDLLQRQKVNEATRDSNVHLDKLTHTISNTSEAVSGHTVVLDRLHGTMTNVNEAAERIGKKGGTISILGDTFGDVTKRIQTYDEEITTAATKHSELAVEIGKVKDGLESVASGMQKIIDLAPALGAALHSVGGAANKAAGDNNDIHSSGLYPNASEGVGPGPGKYVPMPASSSQPQAPADLRDLSRK